MTETEIADRVKKILVQEFELNEEDLAPDVTLYDELGLDSLDSVDLVVALEKEFNFKIVRKTDEEKIRSMRNLRDIYGFVSEKQRSITL